MARILVCDDSAFMRMILKKILQEIGHEIVAEAANGKEAVRLCRQYKPDLITLDITMPDMDGIEAARLIHEEEPLLRIVMVTAIGQRAIIDEAVQAGASDFIVKPFDAGKIVATIHRLVGLAAAE